MKQLHFSVIWKIFFWVECLEITAIIIMQSTQTAIAQKLESYRGRTFSSESVECVLIPAVGNPALEVGPAVGPGVASRSEDPALDHDIM